MHVTTGTHVAQICLFLLTETRYLPARLLQTAPPKRGHANHPGSYSIIDLDLSKYDQLAARFARQRSADLSLLKGGIETRSRRFNDLVTRIEHVASASRAPVLLTGPTGAGKSRLARRIYDLKKLRQRVTGPFVQVNCATVRGDGAMSALFGHVRGAFTGADRERAGLLRTADGGVLFLDEIGELGPDEQAVLLRAIEEKTFLPLGSDREVRSDFQLIAGTNARPAGGGRGAGGSATTCWRASTCGRFSCRDLRERPEDIEPNLDHELREVSAGGARITISRRGTGALRRVRDLPGCGLGRQLPRLQRRRHPDGHARSRRTHHRGGRRRGDRAAATRLARRRRRRPVAGARRAGARTRGATCNSIRSIGSSSPKCCASASARPRSPMRGGGCSACRADARRRRTMPIGCASIWRGSGWSGKPSGPCASSPSSPRTPAARTKTGHLRQRCCTEPAINVKVITTAAPRGARVHGDLAHFFHAASGT